MQRSIMQTAPRQPDDQAQLDGPDLTKPLVVKDEDGKWDCGPYYFLRDTAPGRAEYMDRNGGVCVMPKAILTPVNFESDPEPAPTPDEKVATQERKLYRTRSRTTAQQRANAKATDKQVKYILFLGRQRRIDMDDLRAMTPRKSLSDLSVGEAGRLIDRLKR